MDSKKKILFIGRFPPPIYGTSLMNQKYANSEIINKKFDIKKIKVNFSKDICGKEKISIGKFISGLLNIPKIIIVLFKKPDIVYIDCTVKGLAFYRDSIYILLAKLFRKKTLIGFHSKGIKKETSESRLKEKYYKFVFKNTKAILLSELLYSDIDNLFDKKDVYINPNGIEDVIDDEKFREIDKKRKQRKKKRILFLSNMLETKGPLDTLKICNLLKKEGIDFECLFVGDWEDYDFKKKWLEYQKNNGLEKICRFIGPKYDKEKYELLEDIDFIVFPTRYPLECYPLIILEAFMYGIPVYSYDNGAIREIIDKEYKGYVAKQGNYKDIYKRILKDINKKQENKKIREDFKSKYRFEIAEKRLKKIFTKEIKK